MILQEDIHKIATGIVPAMEKLDAALVEIRQVAKAAREGEGTIGQLLSNPDLYLSLEHTVDRLDELIFEIRLLVEKVRGDGLSTVW